MKKFVQKFILLIAAVAVFFTGAGVTIINYCCTSCSEQTFIMTEKHVCCSQEHDKAKVISTCCSVQKETIQDDSSEHPVLSHDMHCTALRLSMDIDASSFRPHVVTPFVCISDASPALSASITPIKAECIDDYTSFKTPPDSPPREYLSLIRILII